MRAIAPIACLGMLALAAAGPAAAAPSADTVLVKISADAAPAERATISRRLGAGSVRALPRGWRAYRVDDPLTAVQARRAVAGLPAERVEVDQPVYPTADTHRAAQLHLDRIAAPAAWARGTPATPVTVAVLDTGIAIGHRDLAARLWVNPVEAAAGTNAADDDANDYTDDIHGINLVDGARDGRVAGDGTASDIDHGTHVAGLAAAQRDNDWGVAGVADNARILGVRFMSGSPRSGSVSDGILGIQYAVAAGARVVNLSWALTPGSTSAALCDAIAQAGAEGVLVVAAAGNDALDIDSSSTVVPAACPSQALLSVAATDASTDLLAGFSNVGPRSVDLAAPGTQPPLGTGLREGLVSLYPDLLQDSAGIMRGTSMAAPIVAGSAALIMGHRPDLSAVQVAALLRTRGVARADLEPVTLSGRRLDVDAALAAALAIPAAAGEPRPAITAAAPADGAALSAVPQFTWSGAGGDPIEYRLVIDGVAVRSLPGSARQAAAPAGLPDGVHTWHVESTGGARASASRTVTLDRIPPEPFRIGADISTGRVMLSWDAPTDAVSGVASVAVERGGNVIATHGPGAGSHAAGAVPPIAAPETFAVVATDRAGNVRRVEVDLSGVVAQTVPVSTAFTLRVAPARYPRRYEVRARTATAAKVVATGRLAARSRSIRVRLPAALAAQEPALRVRTARMYSTARVRTVRVRPAAGTRRYVVRAHGLGIKRVVATGRLRAGQRVIRVRLPAGVARVGPRLSVTFVRR